MTPLQQAARDISDRWNSPFPTPTETLIAELRKALDAELQQSEPVAEVIECQIMGQQTVREIEGRWKFLQYGDKLYLHPPQPYDQQALELCSECGWKAILPGEPCFVCNMNLDAQQAKRVPMTDNEIAMIAQLTQSAEPGNDGYILPFTFARAIEAHHNINK